MSRPGSVLPAALRRSVQLALIPLCAAALLLAGFTAPASAAASTHHRLVASRTTATHASRSMVRAAPGSVLFSARVMAIAAQYKGAPYRHGGNGPSFDCSGFVKKVFGRMGYSLPRTAAGMRAVTPRISRSALRRGDLVFVYNGGGGSIGHVAIYAGRNHWYEASQPGTPLGNHRAWSSRVSYGRVR